MCVEYCNECVNNDFFRNWNKCPISYGGGEEVGDGLMRERIGEWNGGYGVLEEEYDVLEERGEGGGN